MGIDNSGHTRKQYLVNDCYCEEYEMPGNPVGGYINCVYCGCPPAKQKRDDTLDDTVSQVYDKFIGDQGLLTCYPAEPQ